MKKNLTLSCPGNDYEFTFESVERETVDLVGWKRDWYKFQSSRFTVCCEDACTGERGPKHVLHVFQRPGPHHYRPEVYARSNDNNGEHKEIIVRRGSDDGGLHGEQLDQYIDELLVTRDAVRAMEHLFMEHWAETKAQVDAFDEGRKRLLERRRIVTLNHDQFQVLLPDTETGSPTVSASWREFVNTCGTDDSLWDWKRMFSWASFNFGDDTAALRGKHSPLFCSKVSIEMRSDHVGFRPVMLPLDNDTGTFRPSWLSHLKNGDIVRFGTLYMDDEPVRIHRPDAEFPAHYRVGAKLDIRCDMNDQTFWIPWVVFNGKLMAATNLLCGVSWDDLFQQGFAIG